MDLTGVTTSISSVFVFVLLVLPGFFAVRRKIISSIHIDGFSTLLVNFLWPAMVIDAMTSTTLTQEILNTVLYSLAICLGGYFIAVIVSYIFVRIFKISPALEGISKSSIILNNTGFIGMPLVNAVFGAEGLIIASMAEIVCDCVIFTLGTLFMNGKGKLDIKSMLNPGFLSVIVGLILLFAQLPLPNIISSPISILGNATTPVAMFIIGAQLGELKIKKLICAKLPYVLTFIRLILIPAIVFLMLHFLFPNNSFANGILVIMFAMPSASCTAIFARQYNKDYGFATNCVMLSTVLSVFTLPLWLISAQII